MRRAVGPMIGGALAGCGWWMLRRRGDVPALSATIPRTAPIPRLCRCRSTPALQVLLVGSGASLGREGAPRQLAAALGDLGTSRLALTARDREILLACAAGAGLGAVYSVPLGGALFAARILLGTWHPRAVGTALITSSLAVAVASPVTHYEHVLRWPDRRLSYLFAFLALVVAPLAVAVGLAFDRVMAAARPKVQLTVVGADSRDRVGGSVDRRLLDLVARAARQRPQHPDRQRQRGLTLGAARGHLAAETAADRAVPACGRGRRHAHARAGDRCGGGLARDAGAQSPGRHATSSVCGVADVCRGRAGDHPARAGVRGAVRVGTRPSAVLVARWCSLSRRSRPTGCACSASNASPSAHADFDFPSGRRWKR